MRGRRRPDPACEKCGTISTRTCINGQIFSYKCPNCFWRMRIDGEGKLVPRKNSTRPCPKCSKYGYDTLYSHRYTKKYRCRHCEHVYLTDGEGNVQERPNCPTCGNMMQVGWRRGEAVLYICNTCPVAHTNPEYEEATKNSRVKSGNWKRRARTKFGVDNLKPAGEAALIANQKEQELKLKVAKKAVNASRKSRAAGDYVAPVPKLIHPDVKYPGPATLFPRVEGTQKPGTSARAKLEALREERRDYDPLFG